MTQRSHFQCGFPQHHKGAHKAIGKTNHHTGQQRPFGDGFRQEISNGWKALIHRFHGRLPFIGLRDGIRRKGLSHRTKGHHPSFDQQHLVENLWHRGQIVVA